MNEGAQWLIDLLSLMSSLINDNDSKHNEKKIQVLNTQPNQTMWYDQ